MTSPITTPVTTEAIGADSGGRVSALRSLRPWPASRRRAPAPASASGGGGASASTGVSRLATVSAGGSSAALSCFRRRRKLSFGSSSLDSSPSPGFVVSGSSAMPRVCHGPDRPTGFPAAAGPGETTELPASRMLTGSSCGGSG